MVETESEEGAQLEPLELASDRVAEILRRIVEKRRHSILKSGEARGALPARSPTSALPGLQPGLQPSLQRNAFLQALQGASGPGLIAEVKMGSPRLGNLSGRVDPLKQAELYREGGAAALSVVVEPDFFYGSYELLSRCREVSGLPAIAKDFVVDPVQLEWAAAAGADAVLLIAALYAPATLHALADRARSLGLVPLVETHEKADLDLLAGSEWELVGVNNRDLRTFEVDLAHAEAMAPRLPEGALRVAESGIASRQDIERLQRAGFRAFLVGESLLLADDPAQQLAALLAARGDR